MKKEEPMTTLNTQTIYRFSDSTPAANSFWTTEEGIKGYQMTGLDLYVAEITSSSIQEITDITIMPAGEEAIYEIHDGSDIVVGPDSVFGATVNITTFFMTTEDAFKIVEVIPAEKMEGFKGQGMNLTDWLNDEDEDEDEDVELTEAKKEQIRRDMIEMGITPKF